MNRNLRLTMMLIALSVLFVRRPAMGAEQGRGEWYKRSLLSQGNAARIQHAMAKARRGEPVTIAVIGGSITQGAKASKPQNRYGNLVAQWWRQNFPKSRIQFVNAGIGGTGSSYGCLRAGTDLLARRPDFVIVEFGVNDSGARGQSLATLEGLVRQILHQPNQPAALLLFMMTSKAAGSPELDLLSMPGTALPRKGIVRGLNVQHWHRQVGEHYGLPMVSFRDAIWPDIAAGRLKWEDVIADAVHPNDIGHAHAATFVARLLDQVRAGLPADADLPAIPPLPAARFSDRFGEVSYLPAARLKPIKNDGWTLAKGDWHGGWLSCGRPAAAVEFEFEGTGLLAVLCVPKAHMGVARFRIDDGPWQKQKGWHGRQWNNLVVTKDLAVGLEFGKHTVRIEMTEEKDPAGDSFAFRIHALAVTGARAAEPPQKEK